ncbi:hypothetical protein [Kistimonas scapharcae]
MAKWHSNNRVLMSVFLSSVLGASITPLLADGMHSSHAQHGGDRTCCHHEEMVALPEGVKVPELSLLLFRDAVTGFNLHLNIRNFELESPEYAAVRHEELAQGHAHLFINGKKVKRLYGPYEHLPGNYFTTGENEIKVTLNSHDHASLTVNEKPLSATLKINTEQDDPVISHESTSPVSD